MQTQYADVIVDISQEKLDRPFSYRIPEELHGKVIPGCVVRVPFGRGNKEIRGYVVGIRDHTDYPESAVKNLSALVTDDETVDAKLVALAAWMSRTYGSTTIQALKTVIPVRRKVPGKQKKTIRLADRAEAEKYRLLCVRKHYRAKERVLGVLLDADGTDGMDQAVLMKTADVPLTVINGLIGQGILQRETSDVYRRLFHDAGTVPPDVLSEEQARAVGEIRREWADKNRPVLINGVTGSGKTLVYMELIADVLKEGKEAIVLIPEIALTRQTVLRFVRRFGRRVSFLHSRLSEGERYDQMKAARNGDVSIMVGPRSALFTPFQHLGLIVIDEEQERTYHSEQMPRYHARETAVRRAELEHAHVVLGSATPSLESSWRAERGQYLEVDLRNRYGGSRLPDAEIVDMRAELEKGNRSIFSDRLRELIRDRLEKHEQVMLFLNRRGYAGCVTCRSCGAPVRCPHCDVTLTRHANGTLVCHYCGYTIPELTECPNCHSRQIGGLTIGTEQVEERTRKEFPDARILRMDADTTRGKHGHAKILKEFGEQKADILIGTQMIVKGHDFPDVTLVGILMADLSLNEADFRSSEHTYELITQAVGRAGRGARPGRAVIQTYRPDHFAIVSAAAQDYGQFYRNEIAYRKILGYPPVGNMMAVLGSSQDHALLKKGMTFLKKYIDYIDPSGTTLAAIGPAPQTVGKVRDRYREVIYLRNENLDLLIEGKDKIEKYLEINPGFRNIEIQFDLNQ